MILQYWGLEGWISSDNRRIVLFEENGKIYRGINQNSKLVIRYRVDGGLIPEAQQKKCDYLFILPDEERLYLLELKGCNVRRAAEQILDTLLTLASRMGNMIVNARIVCSRVQTPDIRSSKYIKLESEIATRGGTLKKQSMRLEEQI